MIVSVDASQIEARVNATLSGQRDQVEAFGAGRDVYSEFASRLYGYRVTKQMHSRERQVGKVAILSLGYGSGALTFLNMCRNKDVILTDHEAEKVVNLYRRRHPHIVRNWARAEKLILRRIQTGRAMRWGPLVVERHALRLPNDNRLHYCDLKRTIVKGKRQWQYMRAAMPRTLYGAKLVENACQALAFIHIMETALRIREITQGLLLPAHQVHDELIYVVEERHAEQVRKLVVEEISKSPAWMPDLPLAAEGHIGETYGDLNDRMAGKSAGFMQGVRQ